MRKNTGLFSLIVWYIPVLVVQILAANVTVGGLDPWYQTLQKAAWNPPAWVFGPVWTALYIMMTVSIWLIYRQRPHTAKHVWAYVLFFAQLLLNCLWSFLFFGWHQVGLALIDLALIFIIVGICTLYFYRLHKAAGWLFLPYLLWSGYALTLNAAIWWLNG